MNEKSIQLSLEVSAELNNTLDEMAKKTHSSKGEILKKLSF